MGRARQRYIRKAKRGGFLPLIPLLAAAIPALLGTVAGGLDIAHKVKTLRGEGMRKGSGRRRYVRARRGRGFVGDFLSHIPLLGGILGPLAGKIGLGVHKRGYGAAAGQGLSVMKLRSLNRVAGGRLAPYGYINRSRGGLLSPAGGRVSARHVRKSHYRYVKKSGSGVKRVHVRACKVGGYRPYA